jgi:hypothetical protein
MLPWSSRGGGGGAPARRGGGCCPVARRHGDGGMQSCRDEGGLGKRASLPLLLMLAACSSCHASLTAFTVNASNGRAMLIKEVRGQGERSRRGTAQEGCAAAKPAAPLPSPLTSPLPSCPPLSSGQPQRPGGARDHPLRPRQPPPFPPPFPPPSPPRPPTHPFRSAAAHGKRT